MRALKRHAKSLIALADACVPPNIGGFTAGTPPIGGSGPSSHTAVLPLPSGFDDRSCRLGRTLGSLGSELNVTCPTGRFARSEARFDVEEEAEAHGALVDRRAVAGVPIGCVT